jgi:DNA-binding NarL/FixJ family response regulator
MATLDGMNVADSSTLVVENLRALIVDDHPLFRSAIGELLAREPGFQVVAEVGTVSEAIACLDREPFDVAVVDVVLPDGRGSAVVRHAVAVQPGCKVFALSGIDEPTRMAEMMRAGASGFALKSQPSRQIVDALREVAGGRRSVPGIVREEIDTLLSTPDAWALERLTPRERQVFDLIIGGYNNNGIATKLAISIRTVETHRLRIMTKLAAHSVGDLFRLAVRHGLVG